MIVIVETDESLRLELSSWLSCRGFRTLTFADVHMATALCRGRPIDVAVLGPCFSGENRRAAISLMRALRVSNRLLPFVMLDGSSRATEGDALDLTMNSVRLAQPWLGVTVANTVAALARRCH